jgi:SAM-dependent methyltransferase
MTTERRSRAERARQPPAAESSYVPAAGHAALTRLYDPFMALTMREDAWRPALRDRVLAGLPEGGTVVEVGAGTGTFAIAVAAARPAARVVAIDGDPDALAIAEAKAGAERVDWQEGMAGDLPLDDESVDAVVMSLLLHHLDADAKRAALAAARRVLRPGGELHVADWGKPRDPLIRAGFLLLQALDGFPNTRDHAAGRLPDFIAAAGFAGVATWQRLRTPWGSLELLAAHRALASESAGRGSLLGSPNS